MRIWDKVFHFGNYYNVHLAWEYDGPRVTSLCSNGFGLAEVQPELIWPGATVDLITSSASYDANERLKEKE